jgi:phosphate-selective porin OprO/OprP
VVEPPADGNFGPYPHSPYGDLELRVGGDIQVDGRVFLADASQSFPDQFLLRRVRPNIRGTFERSFAFVLQANLAGGKVQLNHTFLEVQFARWARLRVGKFIVPLSLEVLQSADDTAFTERALPSNLAPYYSVGVALQGEVAAVVFYQVALTDVVPDGATVEGDIADSKEVTGRLFLYPFRTSGVAGLARLGVGTSASYGFVKGKPTATQLPTSYKTDGQNDFFTYLVTTDKVTGKVDPASTAYADGVHVRWSAQGHYVHGPLGLQAEYIRSTQRVLKGAIAETPRNWGWQATAALVLTGEDASFQGGVAPRRAFDPPAGAWGAVEIVARRAVLEVDEVVFAAGLADSAVSSRRAQSWAVGANWYLNRHVRVSADYARTTFRQGALDASGKVVDRAPESAVLSRVQTVF